MRFLAVLAGSIVIACALAVPAVADKARADKLFQDGRKYLTAKEYALACTAFEQSHEADPAIGTQLNIALCYEEWGKTAAAYRAYLEAERLAKLKFDNRSKGARKKVDELAPKVPHLVLELPADADPSTVLLFDKKELARESLVDDLLVDPGPHELEIRVPDAPPKKMAIDVANGERKRIVIELPKALEERKAKRMVTAPRRKGRLYGGIALTVGGAAAMGIAGFVALAARQDYADAIANCDGVMCADRADYDATQDARSRANAMTFVGVGGIVLAGAGVYLMLTSGGAKQEARAPGAWRLTPVVGADRVGFAFGGSL